MFANDFDKLNSLYKKRVLIKEFVANTGQENDLSSFTPEHPTEVIMPRGENSEDCVCNHPVNEVCDCCKGKKDYLNSLSRSMGNQDEESTESTEITEMDDDTAAFDIKQQLFRIVKIAAMLHDLIDESRPVEGWVAAKILAAYNGLDEVFALKDYLEHRKKMESEIQTIGEQTELALNPLVKTANRRQLERVVYEAIKQLEK